MQLIVDTEDVKQVTNINDLLLLSLIKSRITPGYNKVILNYLAVQKQLNISKRSINTACKHLSQFYGITFGNNQIVIYLNKNSVPTKKTTKRKRRKKVYGNKATKPLKKLSDFSQNVIDMTTKILEFLNQLTDTNHKANVTNCELVKNALEQGYTEQQLLMLISRMYVVWHQSSYSQFLVLSTLLKPDKIDDYLNKPLGGHRIPRELRKMLPDYGLLAKRNNIVLANSTEDSKPKEESIVGY